jgi:hypothetical protein
MSENKFFFLSLITHHFTYYSSLYFLDNGSSTVNYDCLPCDIA